MNLVTLRKSRLAQLLLRLHTIAVPGFRVVLVKRGNLPFETAAELLRFYIAGLLRRRQFIFVECYCERGGRAISSELATLDARRIRERTWKGVKIWDIATYGICAELQLLPQEIDLRERAHLDTARVWCSTVEACLEWAASLLQKHKPSGVIYFQGFLPGDAALRAVALLRNLKVFAIEYVARKDRLLWDDISGLAVNRNLAKNYYWRYSNTTLPTVAKAYSQEYIASVYRLKRSEHVAPEGKVRPAALADYIMFIGQVYTDASLVFGLSQLGPIQILERLGSWAQAEGLKVAVKLHPKEAHGRDPVVGKRYERLTYRRMQQSQKLVDLIRTGVLLVDEKNEWDTYAVIAGARFVVTVNSQAGLEAAVMGKQTIVAGDAFYGNCGFTQDWRDEDFGSVAESLSRRDTEKDIQQAEKFFYAFNEKYCIPKTPVELCRKITERI